MSSPLDLSALTACHEYSMATTLIATFQCATSQIANKHSQAAAASSQEEGGLASSMARRNARLTWLNTRASTDPYRSTD